MLNHVCITPPASGWLLFIPTQAPEGGLHARVRLSHPTGEVFATCSDAEGVWIKQFYDIESYIEWLDTLATGPVQSLPYSQPLPRVDDVHAAS